MAVCLTVAATGCSTTSSQEAPGPNPGVIATTTTSLASTTTESQPDGDTTTTSSAATTSTTAATTTTTEDPTKPTIEVNGARLAYNCYGKGTPAVVIELGLVQDSDRSDTWFAFDQAMAGIAETNRVCAYGRRGIGGSEHTKLPVTTQDQVEDLRGLIDALEIEPPVVLVGHSIGAYNVRLFAATHPELVGGLVFVDGTDPGLDAYDPPPHVTLIERLDMYTSAGQVSAVTDLGDLPIYVLTGGRKAPEWWIDELQPRLVALSTNARQDVLDAGHFLHVSDPQVVVDAVAWVVARGD